MISVQIMQRELVVDHTLLLWVKTEGEFNYAPGDYLMMGVHPDSLKPFSIANAPREDGFLEMHIRLNQDSWLQELAQQQVGDHLWIDGPHNQMKLMSEQPLNLFIAGGTGLAPIKALIEAQLAQGLTQPTWLYWGASYVEDFYLRDPQWWPKGLHERVHFVPVLSNEDQAKTVNWQGKLGLVHQVALAEHPDLSQAQVYVCGAWEMIKTVKADCLAAGLPAERIQPL
ncbi:FAD-binding oxidoreductase [Thiomicrospira cyclica]|uniref:Oxidoreductase FAD/NAD(P)-binding domain protein n=1 Tax=Thiomicrospira cyclica (strain DSM 14477 / JCM 11371 / ALM1) TaxID=717773 RepID=F6DB91_THICA|nr:FAD-binding oxidoreductase [Thiomicrospira cyclica]AEG30831.1 oxidoreductase FAD/NAD(P)-binding domain protein [Thiomicrospira cyclica ALM1]